MAFDFDNPKTKIEEALRRALHYDTERGDVYYDDDRETVNLEHNGDETLDVLVDNENAIEADDERLEKRYRVRVVLE